MPTDPPRQLDFRAEVARYDREAEVGSWPGPRHRMTYRVLGQGPPLVLLPGLASTYRGYAPTLLRLADRFQTIQVDYPGENIDDGASLASIRHADLVDDLFELVHHLGLSRVYLFGLSFGSTIALRAAQLDMDRFPEVAVQGGFAYRGMRAREQLALAVGRWFNGPSSRLPFHRRALAMSFRSTFPADQPELWDFFVEENGRTPIRSLEHRLNLLRVLDFRPGLSKIGSKILVIQGTADRLVPMARHEELVRGLARPTPVLMEGVGHQPHWTHPAELAALVGDFPTRTDRDRA